MCRLARWPTVRLVFGRKKQDEIIPDAAATSPVKPGAKNRPTPTRREAEAARRQPLVPTDRKAAAKAAKLKEREARTKQRQAMMNGEEWALLPRDRGPQKAYIRDHVDGRWNIGEFVLPIMILGLPLTMIQNATTVTMGIVLVYGAMLATMVDLAISSFQLKKKYQGRFGGPPPKGTLWTVAARSIQMRRTRVPKPQVKRGQPPR
ncbi:MAG: DUF3043 domain-containing protein [Austwickia sp.]|jgi:hypothetical protein|nr:DUF3043 domain-containing protein [Austwickia sp.]MBK8435612.1 DUF3043 domain-containing protein [Austwickia sp.]MBK9100818.1 DUF3043 domain-containing protein [Austwickia sp.]